MIYGRGKNCFIAFLGIVMSFLLSSCTKQLIKSNADEDQETEKSALLERVIQQEAMLVNVPLPLFDERIIDSHDNVDPDALVLGYKSPLTHSQVSDFFMLQMERYGWQHLVSFAGHEQLLQFANPDEYCTIVIRSIDTDHSLIFIYIKRAST